MNILFSQLIKKYSTYASNIEWHINTNKPDNDVALELSKRVKDYKEVVNDLKELERQYASSVGAGRWVKADVTPKELLQGYYCKVYSKHFKKEFRKIVVIALDKQWLTEDEVIAYLDESPTPTVEDSEGWISVEDKLPEMCEFVLVHNTEGAIMTGRLFSQGWYASFLNGEGAVKELAVTHWKHLPKPPKP